MKKILPLIPAVLFLLTALQVTAQDATALYNEGLVLKKERKPAAAIEKFKAALAIRPAYTEAMYEMGWCHNDLKDYKAAISTLRKVRVSWPAVPKVYFELAYAFEKTESIDSAVQNYNKCLQLKPDYSNAYKQLGYIHYNRDDNEKALEMFRSYEKNAKDSITDYTYFYRKGFCYNAVKKYDSAVLSLNQATRLKPDHVNALLELGFAHARLKKDDDAVRYYKRAIELDPKSHIPYNGIGEVYRDNKKDMNEAMVWYKKTLALNSTERKACFGMGYCLNNQQKYTEAIPYLRTAIEKEPNYTAAFVELGYSLYKTQAYTEAEEKLLKAISLTPKNENSRYYLTLLYISQKNRAKAQQMVDDLKNLSSKYAQELQNKVNAM